MMHPKAAAAWAAFRHRVAELGGEVLEPSWLGSKSPHRVRCAAGHDATPTPSNVNAGVGLCAPCAGQDADAAAAAFRRRVTELGGILLEPAWLGSRHPHRVRCAGGHDLAVRPRYVRQAPIVCPPCRQESRTAPPRPRRADVAWSAFRARVAELGGTVIEAAWLGSKAPHRVRCAAGHESSPTPETAMKTGKGICRTCAGQDSAEAWQAFRRRVAELGGAVIEPAWLGNATPHRVRCPEGHAAAPLPNNVLRGKGLCRRCVGATWDAFYVVTGPETVKFGITSGDPRPRLATHRTDGLPSVVRLFTDLPDDVAPILERVCLSALADAGVAPVRGREYFPVDALALVLDVVDGHGLAG